jgi:hypothetical protein
MADADCKLAATRGSGQVRNAGTRREICVATAGDTLGRRFPTANRKRGFHRRRGATRAIRSLRMMCIAPRILLDALP